MIDVSELIKSVMAGKYEIMAGQMGLNKVVETVGILEYESKEEVDDNFFKGDFVITSLFFTKDSEQLATETLMRLMDNNVSAIALKTIHVDHVSDKVLDYANEKNVPIIYFHSIQFEVLIMLIVDAIRQKKNYLYYEALVDKLLIDNKIASDVKNIAYSINSSFLDNVKIMYCKEKNIGEFSMVQRIIDTQSIKRSKASSEKVYSIFQYHDGLMIIYSHKSDEHISQKTINGFVQSLGIDNSLFNIGISFKSHKLSQLDFAIKKALYAYDGSIEKNQSVSFNSLSINRLLMPLKNDYFAKDYSDSIVNAIIKHDHGLNGPLLITARDYIKHNGSLIESSKSLHQHVNTIRYRINKIKELIDASDDDFYEELYFAIKLYELDNKEKITN